MFRRLRRREILRHSWDGQNTKEHEAAECGLHGDLSEIQHTLVYKKLYVGGMSEENAQIRKRG